MENLGRAADQPESPDGINVEEARRFLSLLDESIDTFCFRTIDDSEHKRGSLTMKLRGELAEVAPALVQMNQSGAGVFVVVNHGGDTDAEITRLRAVFADLDGAPLDPVMRCGLEPHLVVESSPERFHTYWFVDGLACDQFSDIQKAIAARFGSDRSVSNVSRLMRLPGFLHQKSDGCFRSRIIHENGAQPYKAARMIAAFPRTSALTPPESLTRAGDVTYIKGMRNNALMSRAGSMRRDGFDEDEILSALQSFNTRACSPPLAAAEVTQVARSAMRYAPEPVPSVGGQEAAESIFEWLQNNAPESTGVESAARTFKFTKAREILLKPTPIAWAVRNYFARDSLVAVNGQPGSAKTFIALDWSACMSTGTAWFGNEVAKGAVFYLCGEGHAGISRRLRAWEVARGISLADAPLFVSNAAICLNDPMAAQQVLDAVDALGAQTGAIPILIVVDTLARHNSGDENDTKDMSAFIRTLDIFRNRYGATVLVVHHAGHGDGQRGRGSSAQRAAWDTEFFVIARDEARALICTKAKDWETPEPVQFGLRPIELPEPWVTDEGTALQSAVVDINKDNGIDMTPTQKAAVELLKELCARQRAYLERQGIQVDVVRVPKRDFMTALNERGVVRIAVVAMP